MQYKKTELGWFLKHGEKKNWTCCPKWPIGFVTKQLNRNLIGHFGQVLQCCIFSHESIPLCCRKGRSVGRRCYYIIRFWDVAEFVHRAVESREEEGIIQVIMWVPWLIALWTVAFVCSADDTCPGKSSIQCQTDVLIFMMPLLLTSYKLSMKYCLNWWGWYIDCHWKAR